jgi:CcmD family protein
MDERNFTYMFYGFSVTWAIIAIYVMILAGREKGIRKQLESLKRILEDKK